MRKNEVESSWMIYVQARNRIASSEPCFGIRGIVVMASVYF